MLSAYLLLLLLLVLQLKQRSNLHYRALLYIYIACPALLTCKYCV